MLVTTEDTSIRGIVVLKGRVMFSAVIVDNHVGITRLLPLNFPEVLGSKDRVLLDLSPK